MFPINCLFETVVKTLVSGYKIINLKCWISCYFEPTFTLNGIPISRRWMSGLRLQWKAETGAAVTHLALLGVKIWETALWDFEKS